MSESVAAVSNIYVPLPSPTSIRLIRLQGYTSHASSKEQVIAISLDTVDLKTSPPFDALSYTWGDPLYRELDASLLPTIQDGPNMICCGGLVVPVQPNLFHALRMLLSVEAVSRADYVWIDALCINQADSDEMAAQVGIMGSIYLRAEKTIAWLGPEDATIPDALSVLDRLAFLGQDMVRHDPEVHEESLLSDINEHLFLHPEEQKAKLGIEPISLWQWMCFVAFLARPYFSRLWIVQEVTLAKKVTAICGARLVDWDKITAAGLFLIFTNWSRFLHPRSLRDLAGDAGLPAGFENLVQHVAPGSCVIKEGVSDIQLEEGSSRLRPPRQLDGVNG
jgi:hypothetical protein